MAAPVALAAALTGVALGGAFTRCAYSRELGGPPRELATRYWMYAVTPFNDYVIPGVELWVVPEGARYVVGWDPAEQKVVANEELFQRARAMAPTQLAAVANDTIGHGMCKIVTVETTWTSDGGEPVRAQPPHVEASALVFWCDDRGVPTSRTYALVPGMLAP